MVHNIRLRLTFCSLILQNPLLRIEFLIFKPYLKLKYWYISIGNISINGSYILAGMDFITLFYSYFAQIGIDTQISAMSYNYCGIPSCNPKYPWHFTIKYRTYPCSCLCGYIYTIISDLNFFQYGMLVNAKMFCYKSLFYRPCQPAFILSEGTPPSFLFGSRPIFRFAWSDLIQQLQSILNFLFSFLPSML